MYDSNIKVFKKKNYYKNPLKIYLLPFKKKLILMLIQLRYKTFLNYHKKIGDLK